MSEPVAYLTFDLSYAATGWATNLPGRAAGRRCFPLGPGGHDARAAAASAWLLHTLTVVQATGRRCRPPRAVEVVYELPLPHSPGALAGQYAHELQWMLRDYCHTLGIPCRGVNAKTLKRFATGNGNAGKDLMVHAASLRFPTYDEARDPGGDIADSRWLLAYGEAGFPVVAAKRPAAAKRRPRKKVI